MCAADINKHWPGSDIALASYWTRAAKVPLSAVHALLLQEISNQDGY
jgi:hypothetical protein